MPEEQRYRKEIEEILAKSGEKPQPRKKRIRQSVWTPIRNRKIPNSNQRTWKLITPTNLLLLGVFILFLSIFVLNMYLFWTGLIVVTISYVAFFNKNKPKYEKRWRGQPIEQSDRTSGSSRKWPWFNKN